MANVLIVDNDARIVELTAFFLERGGHQVETALSYAEARSRIDARRPDLMLADLDLGQEQGREELPKLAAEGRLPRTLVVSGFLDTALERELLAIPGVEGTLTKPVDLQHLLARIAGELSNVVLVPRAPRPRPPAASAEMVEDEDGWTEIAPLRPDVQRATDLRSQDPARPPWTPERVEPPDGHH